MDPPAPLRDRDPLDAVDAALELEAAPRPATLDEEDRVLDAPRTGRAGVHDLDFPALALRVLRVHAHEVRGEQRGLLRSEEHTSELQSLTNLVCRLLLEKKKQQI